MLNFNNYTNALSEFYTAAAYWKYSSSTDKKGEEEYYNDLKKKAVRLQNEMKNLPPDMVRPQVVKHIEKILSL